MEDINISRRVRDAVEDALRDSPAARKNDMILLTRIWSTQGFLLPPMFAKEAFNAEKIIYWRKRLQESNRYRPD